MKFRIAIGLALFAAPAAASAAMPVSTFLAKADRLQKRGPLALFSSDLRLLKNRVTADAAEIRKERLAAEAAGRRGAFCPPAGGVKLTDRDIVAAMQAVPPPQRATTSTKAALRAYMVRRFPCA